MSHSTTSSTPNNKHISPSSESLHQIFENTLSRYKEQLTFTNFLQYFPDDFSVDNFDILQKLYRLWVQNLEGNIRKEYQDILQTYQLEKLLHEKDRNSVAALPEMMDTSQDDDEDSHNTSDPGQNEDLSATAAQQKHLLQEYETLSRDLNQQIQEKKQKVNQFMGVMNESMEMLQKMIEKVSSSGK